jgi:hypothetical protein
MMQRPVAASKSGLSPAESGAFCLLSVSRDSLPPIEWPHTRAHTLLSYRALTISAHDHTCISPPPTSPLRLLVIGGAGYIGYHMVKHLMCHGCDVVIFDNLSTKTCWLPQFVCGAR